MNTDLESQMQVHRQMIHMLASLPTKMPVAVFLLGRNLKMIQDFTTDPELLKTALQKAQTVESNEATKVEPQDDPGALSASAETMDHFPPDALNAMEQFEREVYAMQMDQRVSITLDALRALTRYASGYPGRKNLLWISSSFPIAIDSNIDLGLAGLRNYQDQLAKVGTEFAESKIAIYPMDPAGLQVSSIFQASGRGAGNPQRIAGQLAREEQARYNREITMRVLAENTGGIVCVNDNDLGDCMRKAVSDGSSFYEIAYYPNSGSWNGEYHKIKITMSKPGIHLAYRRGYYANSQPTDQRAAERELQEAACRDLLNSTFLLVAAKQLPVDQPGKAAYFMEIDPGKLTFIPQNGGTRELALKIGVCTFDKSGRPLQFMQQTIKPKLSDKQYSVVQANGYPHYIVLTPAVGVATVRLLVQDTASGEMGSVNVPYTEMVASTATAPPASGAASPPQTPAAH